MGHGHGVQGTTTALWESKLKFPHEGRDSLPADRECTAMKGHSALCYSHSTRRQPEVEAVSGESPDPAPLVISCARKVCSSLSCTTRSWLPGHPYSQGAAGCPLVAIGMTLVSALFMALPSLHPGEGRNRGW